MAQPEMESGSAVPEANWGSYQSQIQNEESEIVAQFLTPYPPYQNEPESQDLGLSRPPAIFWPDQHANSYYYNGNSNNYNMCYWSQTQGESSNSSSNNNYLASHPENYENYYLNEPNVALEMNTISAPVDFNLVDEQNKSKSIHLVPNPSFGDQAMNEENGDENGNVSPNESDSSAKRKFLGTLDGAKKKVRSSTHVQKSENKPSSKKVKNNRKNGEEELENNGAINKQSPSSCDSDNDSNGSPENNASGVTSRSSKGNAAANLNGKGRAGRGSATDPQSLYARKRRERINERLKVLQSLVPNGTKVDISTMLEEAVQYVKFLQVQIKLLSNDEMWMYAPIAYNGMSLGIDLKISPPQ